MTTKQNDEKWTDVLILHARVDVSVNRGAGSILLASLYFLFSLGEATHPVISTPLFKQFTHSITVEHLLFRPGLHSPLFFVQI